MTLTRKFRLYAVTIHDKTTREAIVPEHELGVIKAAWRPAGINVTSAITNDVREIVTDPAIAYRSLQNRYSQKAVAAMYPGPERLEQDMAAAADKTDAWLKQVAENEERAAAAARARARAEREADAAAAEREAAEAKAHAEAKAAAEQARIDAEAKARAEREAKAKPGGVAA